MSLSPTSTMKHKQKFYPITIPDISELALEAHVKAGNSSGFYVHSRPRFHLWPTRGRKRTDLIVPKNRERRDYEYC
jgi:hypothetical protein